MVAELRKQNWPGVAELARKQIALLPQLPDPYYNLGCALARQNKSAESLTALSQAIDHGYNDPAHMKVDDDLASLKEDPAFLALIKRAREAEINAPYEKGAEIAGIRSIEAAPEGALRYRLRVGEEVKPEKPAKLIIWLHPSGGSMNNVVEALSPMLAKQNYALLVVTRKQFVGWTTDEVDRLLGPTLADVATHKEIDAAKPILMGFSAGGQAALQAWEKAPDKFAGLILDAAYPIDTAQYARGRIAVMTPPKVDGIKNTPIISFVGGDDTGGATWLAAKPKWLEAGIPLSTRIVPGKGHAWLIDGPRVKDLTTWLEAIAAGKKPHDFKPLPPNAL